MQNYNNNYNPYNPYGYVYPNQIQQQPNHTIFILVNVEKVKNITFASTISKPWTCFLKNMHNYLYF